MVMLPATTIALLTRPLSESCTAGDLVLADPASTLEAGIRWPVYFTREAHRRHVAVTDAAAKMLCDERGRLWDVAYMLSRAIRGLDGDACRFTFAGVVDQERAHRCTLVAVIAVDDNKPNVVLLTAGEAMEKDDGDAIDAYDRLLDIFDDTDDDRGDPLDW